MDTRPTMVKPRHLELLSMPLYGVLMAAFAVMDWWQGMVKALPVMVMLLGAEFVSLQIHSAAHHSWLWLARPWVKLFGFVLVGFGAMAVGYWTTVPILTVFNFLAGQLAFDAYFHDREHRTRERFHRSLTLVVAGLLFTFGLVLYWAAQVNA